jgi:hypothetical protein
MICPLFDARVNSVQVLPRKSLHINIFYYSNKRNRLKRDAITH